MVILQLIITGIAVGALYGLAGIGFNLIFSTTRMFDISIGATYLIVAYVYYSLVAQARIPVAATAVVAVAIGGLCGLAFYLGVYSWIERRSFGGFFTYFVASFGVLTVVQNLLAMIYGSARVFIGQGLLRTIGGSALEVPKGDIVAIGVAIIGYAALELVLNRTRIGVRFRAMGENQDLLRTIGLGSRRYWALAFVMGSVLVGASAIVTTYLQGVAPSDGFTLANFAIAAVLLGGVGRYRGALFGGLLLGVVENVALAWVPGAWEQAVGFGVLLVVLLFRPSGLLGSAV